MTADLFGDSSIFSLPFANRASPVYLTVFHVDRLGKLLVHPSTLGGSARLSLSPKTSQKDDDKQVQDRLHQSRKLEWKFKAICTCDIHQQTLKILTITRCFLTSSTGSRSAPPRTTEPHRPSRLQRPGRNRGPAHDLNGTANQHHRTSSTKNTAKCPRK